MRVKYIKSADLGVVESTVNLLLSQGWDRDSGLMLQPDGEYLMTLYNQDRPPRGTARALDPYRTTPVAREVMNFPDYNPHPESEPELDHPSSQGLTAIETIIRGR